MNKKIGSHSSLMPKGPNATPVVGSVVDPTNKISQNKQIVKDNFPTDSDTELKQHLASETEEQAKADELLTLREENKALKAMDKRRWQMIDYPKSQSYRRETVCGL